MNNKISNPKTEVPSGIEMNDKDNITSLLCTLKELEKNYTVAMTEASNEFLFNKIERIFNEIKTLQRQTYEVMFKNGWYQLEKAETQKINEKYQMLQQEYNGLS